MAAREVAVAALATAYSVDAGDEDATAMALGDRLAGQWSLATALAFLAWFVFAPQCISTIAVAKRETNGWKWPMFMVDISFCAGLCRGGHNLLDSAVLRLIATLSKSIKIRGQRYGGQRQ